MADYAQLPGVYDAALSPSGKWLGVIMEANGSYVVRILNLADPSDKTLRLQRFDDTTIPYWINWASDDQVMVSVRGKGKFYGKYYPTGHLYTGGPDLKDMGLLVKQDPTRTRGAARSGSSAEQRLNNNRVVDFLVDDPDHILMQFSDRDYKTSDVQKVNLKTKDYDIEKRGSMVVGRWVTDLRGQIRVGEGYDSSEDQYYVTIRDAQSDTWNSVANYPGLNGESDEFLGFMENPNEMIVGRYNGQNTRGLYIYDLSQKRQTRKLFHNPDYDYNGLVYSPDRKKVIGASFHSTTGEIEFFDTAAKLRLDKVSAALTGYTVRYMDESLDGSKILVKALAQDVPAKLVLYDVKTGGLEVLGSDYPKLDSVQQGDVKSVSYKARDGQKIPAYVTLPHKVTDSGKIENVPFIILPHGGPFARNTASFDYLAQFMASRGYAVLQMDFRGSTGYGREFSDAGRDNAKLMQTDVEDGARWLIEKGYADPDRMCIVGWSYGGYAALMGAANDPDLYSCTVSMAGVTDLKEMFRNMAGGYRVGADAPRYSMMRGFNSFQEVIDNSPTKIADQIKSPVLLAHADMDFVVPINQYNLMVSALRKSDAKVTKLKIREGDHSLRLSEGRMEFMKALDKFLKENLGPSEYAP